jgi:hypothetical protein
MNRRLRFMWLCCYPLMGNIRLISFNQTNETRPNDKEPSFYADGFSASARRKGAFGIGGRKTTVSAFAVRSRTALQALQRNWFPVVQAVIQARASAVQEVVSPFPLAGPAASDLPPMTGNIHRVMPSKKYDHRWRGRCARLAPGFHLQLSNAKWCRG